LSEIIAYALALKLILYKKYSLERAFKIASKKIRIDLQQFIRIIRNFWYYKELYPNRRMEEIIKIILNSNDIINPIYSLPQWVLEKLLPNIGKEGIIGLYNSKKWIRINTLKCEINSAIKELEDLGFVLNKDKDYDNLYEIVREPFPISRTELYKKGLIIPHDKSSLLVVSVLDPKPDDVILEIGSAPGIKTSIIQEFTGNGAKVISLDISPKRIKVQKNLMKKWNVENVELVIGDGLHLPFIKNVDKILIDAPCSNSGTINTDPSVFLRISKREVNFYSKLQYKIIENISKFSVPVIFSTCSLFYDEGEKVVYKFKDFLRENNLGEDYYGYGKIKDKVIRTYPHKHYTQGFFIAYLDFN
jgi:16S rRNA (cytosine967-C5)-methyltransferase